MSIEYRGETFSGYNKPKRTPSHPKKSHVVLAKVGKNIARGKLSAAYWADKVKWQRNISMGSTQKEKENEAIYTQIEMDLLLEQIKEDERKEAMQNHLDAEADKRDKAGGIKKGMNKGGMPKKDFAKPGSYSSAYNKGGMGKAKTGHTDYRKGGMVYGSKK